MKRYILAFSMLVCFSSLIWAQSLSEIFKENESLQSIFVNPLGITDVIEDTDIESLESKVIQLGLSYDRQSLGPFGEALSVIPPEFKIGGVDVSRMTILVNKAIKMLLLTTSPSDGFLGFCSYLEKHLHDYNIKMESNRNVRKNFKLYMVSDQYGIAVGSVANKKTATAILMDMHNLKGFIELGSLFSKL